MIINNAISYSEEEQVLVRHYEGRKIKSSDDWIDEAFKKLKSNIKNHYKNEQNYTCPYCKVKYPVTHGMVWDIEHIIPKDKNPLFMFKPKNLCVACKDCNGAKSNKNVLVNEDRVNFTENNEHYKIVHPHFDRYDEHIRAILPGDLYRPLTPKGEFTIIACRLLRFYKVVNREQPNPEIDELARALIGSEGAARRVLEDELVRRITTAREA